MKFLLALIIVAIGAYMKNIGFDFLHSAALIAAGCMVGYENAKEKYSLRNQLKEITEKR